MTSLKHKIESFPSRYVPEYENETKRTRNIMLETTNNQKYFVISSVSKYYLKILRGWKKVNINLIWLYNMAVVAE